MVELSCRSAIRIGLSVAAMAWPSFCLAQSTTESYGERSEFDEIYEYGQGSTLQSVTVTAEVEGQPVELVTGVSRYFIPYTPEEVAAMLPGRTITVDGGEVTISAWALTYVDTQYDIIDTFFSSSTDYFTDGIVTVQTTSGDGPNPFVPTGSLGYCFSDGTTGETNFGSFNGSFASCESTGEEFFVTPGTTNTHTHTTTVYREVVRNFESTDDGYHDFYLALATASTSTSNGTMQVVTNESRTLRTDNHAVRLQGRLGNETLFDRTLGGLFGDSATQTALADLSRPTAHALGGAPVVVTWSAPSLTGTATQLQSSNTVTTSTSDTSIITTQTVTQGGGTVMIGTRGACTTLGTATVQADCAGGYAYQLSGIETNTNTHTTTLTTITNLSTTTESYLTTASYTLNGSATAIGQIHAAARDTLFAGSTDFARRHGAAVAQADTGLGLWTTVAAGSGETDSNGAGPGNSRDSWSGSGGITFALPLLAQVGVAVSHSSGDTTLAGGAERAEISLTQLGVAGEIDAASWLLRAGASRGWAEIETTRGSTAIGGVAQADYSGSTWNLFAELGPEIGPGLGLVSVTLRPFVAVDWTRAELGAFDEAGGIGLGGDADSASRTAVMLGLDLGAQLGGLELWSDARVGQIVDGSERQRGVFFLTAPAAPLTVTSASEGDTFAEGRAGLRLSTGGFAFTLGAEATTASGNTSWRALAGISAAF